MTVSTPSSTISPGDLERLEQLYTFRDHAAIVEFLDANLFLIPLLLEARGKIEEYFPRASVFLEFGCDPESTEEDCWIMAYIATKLSIDDAFAARERFGDEWWLGDAIDLAQMKLNIDIEPL